LAYDYAPGVAAFVAAHSALARYFLFNLGGVV